MTAHAVPLIISLSRMNSNTKNEWQYQSAFVIQFRPETDITAECCKGRVEHVVTYEATHFQSLAELLAFVARILREAEVSRQGQWH